MRHLGRVFVSFFIVAGFSTSAFATSVGVGLLTFDADTPTALATFDITNLTGTNALPPDFPITTPLTITVTNLVANLQGGGSVTIGGANFTVVDPQGDLNCTVAGDAAAGGCELSTYSIVSATLTGTFSPTTGLAGLPGGGTSIVAAFSTTITPDPNCIPSIPSGVSVSAATLIAGCDATTIFATTPVATAVPEPETLTLLELGLVGLAARYRFAATGKVARWLRVFRS